MLIQYTCRFVVTRGFFNQANEKMKKSTTTDWKSVAWKVEWNSTKALPHWNLGLFLLVLSVIVSRCIQLWFHPLHFPCLLRSILSPTYVFPRMLGEFRHTLPSFGGYFALSTVSLIRSPMSWAEPILIDAHGLLIYALLRCIHPDPHRSDESVLALVFLWLHSISVFDMSWPDYTGSRLKTTCLKGRGFWPYLQTIKRTL